MAVDPARLRVAAIDIGSNTVKLVVAEVSRDGLLAPVLDAGATTRLGQGMRSRMLGEDAMRRTLNALHQCLATCSEHRVVNVAAVGTSALRDAANRDAFLERASSIGLHVRVLDGAEEARLSALAVRSDAKWRNAPSIIVVDIGGGSTEIITDRMGAATQTRASLQLGGVRLTEALLPSDPPDQAEVKHAREAVAAAFRPLALSGEDATAIGVGGTLTNLGGVSLGLAGRPPQEDLHGLVLPLDEIRRQIELYTSMPVSSRRLIAGLDPARADIILAGALIVEGALMAAQREAITVSCRGLRWGVLYDLYGGASANA
jgi:exopolyphosphatase/guanosine-5'-triphosphate,3'-diphosphate pyrophosphatase